MKGLPEGRGAAPGWARQIWGRTAWARLGRIAAALERMEAQRPTLPALHDVVPEPLADRNGIGIWHRLGLTLLLDGASDVDRRLIESGGWETEQFAKLQELVVTSAAPSGPRIFLDIGAYFGLYALEFDRERLFDQIIAFEPDRLNFAQLQAQLFLNGATYRIDARNVAVGEVAGTGQMHRSDRHPTGNRGGVGLRDSGDARCVPVGIVAIDNEISVEGGLIVAKIDVEGNQDYVLRGMRSTIARNACVLQIEVFEQARSATLALLNDLGLSIAGEIYPDIFATRDPP